MIQALERPATTASATKSCSLTASVSPRICRAKRGQSRSAITRTTLRKLGSETATSTTAIRMVGRERPTCLDRFIDDAIAPDVLHELPRPRRDGMPLGAVVLGGLHVALGLDEGHRGEQTLVDLVAERHEGLLEAHGERVGTLDLHALDQPELGRERVGGAVLGEGGEREPHVLGGQFAASVVELDALAQIEGPGAAAVRDFPALRQHGSEIAGLRIAGEEVLVHRLEDHVLGPDVQVRKPALVAE